MEIIKVENNEIALAEEALQVIKSAYEAKMRFDITVDAIKKEAAEAMEKYGIKSFENDFMKIVYKAPSTRKGLDTERLKEEGLYELYLKETPVKSSVVVTFK